jgi:hypothetical protein
MDKNRHPTFFNYAESITRIEGKIPQCPCSGLVNILQKKEIILSGQNRYLILRKGNANVQELS